MPFESSLSLYDCTLLPKFTISTAGTAMCQYCSKVTVCHSNPHSLYQCTLLPICTVAIAQLLYAIPILTVTISVHTVTSMYGSHSRVTVCHSNAHCHYTSAHCYRYVRYPQYSYCMPFQSSLSLYQCTLLTICTVATVQLLYAIPILALT